MSELLPTEDRFALTSQEIMFNRIFSAFLFFSPLILFWNILVLPTVVVFIVFALFLFFSKKHHPVINFLFLLLALCVYFVPLPIGWALFLSLREFKFSGYAYNHVVVFWLIVRAIFVFLSARNVLGDIIIFLFRPREHQRNLLYPISLIFLMMVGLVYPLLANYQLRQNAMDGGSSELGSTITKQELVITEPGKGGNSSSLARKFYTAKYDPATKKYVYHLTLPYPLENAIEFKSVETDDEEINFVTDQRVKCPHCQINNDNPKGLVFPAGQNIDFIIYSDEFVKTIDFIESNGNTANFIFWK